MDKFEDLISHARVAFDEATELAQLDQVKARFLGKTGALAELRKGIASLPKEERPKAGARFNEVKDSIEQLLSERREAIQALALSARLEQEKIDVTLPGRDAAGGGLHPVTRTLERVTALCRTMGFDVADGPEIESDFFNFTALNQPEDHPARSMHDTFYLEGEQHLLRTHTSPIQIHYMLENRPPFRVISPGRVYRVDSDANPLADVSPTRRSVDRRNGNLFRPEGCGA